MFNSYGLAAHHKAKKGVLFSDSGSIFSTRSSESSKPAYKLPALFYAYLNDDNEQNQQLIYHTVHTEVDQALAKLETRLNTRLSDGKLSITRLAYGEKETYSITKQQLDTLIAYIKNSFDGTDKKLNSAEAFYRYFCLSSLQDLVDMYSGCIPFDNTVAQGLLPFGGRSFKPQCFFNDRLILSMANPKDNNQFKTDTFSPRDFIEKNLPKIMPLSSEDGLLAPEMLLAGLFQGVAIVGIPLFRLPDPLPHNGFIDTRIKLIIHDIVHYLEFLNLSENLKNKFKYFFEHKLFTQKDYHLQTFAFVWFLIHEQPTEIDENNFFTSFLNILKERITSLQNLKKSPDNTSPQNLKLIKKNNLTISMDLISELRKCGFTIPALEENADQTLNNVFIQLSLISLYLLFIERYPAFSADIKMTLSNEDKDALNKFIDELDEEVATEADYTEALKKQWKTASNQFKARHADVLNSSCASVAMVSAL